MTGLLWLVCVFISLNVGCGIFKDKVLRFKWDLFVYRILKHGKIVGIYDILDFHTL